MRRLRKSTRKHETSKIILLVSYLIAIALTIVCIVGAFLDKDMTSVAQITLAAYVEVSASNVWYLKKAMRENIFKNLPKEKAEQIDPNNLL